MGTDDELLKAQENVDVVDACHGGYGV